MNGHDTALLPTIVPPIKVLHCVGVVPETLPRVRAVNVLSQADAQVLMGAPPELLSLRI